MPAKSDDRHSGRLDDWLFATLRFAVTRKPCDRATVLTLAEELDRLGAPFGSVPTTFTFFARTSTALCNAIASGDAAGKLDALRVHLATINDGRLRRALEAAIGMDAEAKRPRSRQPNPTHLWRGLGTSRGKGARLCRSS